jgi:uncharacterized membrane protein YfcA
MIFLSALFLLTAILYSSVGFGGGSTYLALLLLWDTPYTIFPILALACNIAVVSGSSFNYIRHGHFNKDLLLPYLIGSIPFAYWGGSLVIERNIFEIILFIVLLAAGILLLLNFKFFGSEKKFYKTTPIYVSISIGSVFGLISGIVGIGGGIFLSPMLFLLQAGKPRDIATTASIFILINSISGLVAQLQKSHIETEILDHWFLILCVVIGGQIGNYLNLKILPSKGLAALTAILVLFVALRMGYKIF